MKTALVIYGIILAVVFLYIPGNTKLNKLIVEKYGRRKGGNLLKLFRMTGIILLSVFILRLFLSVLEKGMH